MTTHEPSVSAGMLERARVQNAVLLATADAGDDIERLLAALAGAVPASLAWSGPSGTLRYDELPAASRTGPAFTALHRVRERRSDRVLSRARALLALIGVRPGRRFGFRVSGFARPLSLPPIWNLNLKGQPAVTAKRETRNAKR